MRFLCCKGRFCTSKVISCFFESEKFNINGKESKVAFCTETRTFAADLKIHRGSSKARELEIRIQFRSLKEHRARSSIRRRLGLI